MLSGMENSVDPDQTAPSGAVWSGSALFAYAISSETLVYKILGHLPYDTAELLPPHYHPVLFAHACISEHLSKYATLPLFSSSLSEQQNHPVHQMAHWWPLQFLSKQ